MTLVFFVICIVASAYVEVNRALISGTRVLVMEFFQLVVVLNGRNLCSSFFLSCIFALFNAWFSCVIRRRQLRCCRVPTTVLFVISQYMASWNVRYWFPSVFDFTFLYRLVCSRTRAV